MNENTDDSKKDLFAEAKAAEESGEIEKAIAIYESIITKDPVSEYAYERLFILLRKLKDYKQELKLIKAAIKAFESLNNQGKKKSKKILELSKMLNKVTGLTDKKGNTAYKPEPIARWEKRKLVVEKKLSK